MRCGAAGAAQGKAAYLEIGGDGRAAFAFGAAQGGGEIEYSRTIVFFRWNGFDEGDEGSGKAYAELQENGPLQIGLRPFLVGAQG